MDEILMQEGYEKKTKGLVMMTQVYDQAVMVLAHMENVQTILDDEGYVSAQTIDTARNYFSESVAFILADIFRESNLGCSNLLDAFMDDIFRKGANHATITDADNAR